MHSLTLQTGEATVVDGDILGRLGFAASNEVDGMLDVTAKLEAVAEKTFDGSNNATEMVFSLAADGTVASKMTLGSTGLLTLTGNLLIPNGGNIGSVGDPDAIAIATGGVVTMNQIPVFSAGINVSGGTITGTMADNSINSDMYVDGSIDTAHIADSQVTLAKIATITDERILGRVNNSTATVAELTKAQVLTMLNVADGATAGAGTVTSVTAGAGMTQSGTDTVNPTLDVIGGNGITANANDVAITAAQTTITSVHNAALVIGRGADNDIDFATDNNIIFRAGGEDQLTLTNGFLTPSSDAIVDLGTSSLQFKDAYFHGTLEADAITIGGTNVVTGEIITTLGTVSAGTWQGTTIAVDQGGTGATSLADKAVLITQDSGTDTVAAVAMSTNGQLLIGGTSGPAVSTLTAGSNVTITNANGAITIAAASGGDVDVSGTPTAGHVAIWTDADTLQMDENQLFWDTSSNELGIGTNAPGSNLDVRGNLSFATYTVGDTGDADWATNVHDLSDATKGANYHILCDTDATSRTVKLPDAVASIVGRTYVIKKIDSGVGTVTIWPDDNDGTEGYLDGDNVTVDKQSNVLFNQYDTISCTCGEGNTNGQYEWHIVHEKITAHTAVLEQQKLDEDPGADYGQQLAHGTWTQVHLDTTIVGRPDSMAADASPLPDDMYDPTSYTTDGGINIQRDGLYLVTGTVWLDNNMDDGKRMDIAIYKNGSKFRSVAGANGSGVNQYITQTITQILELEKGDNIELWVYQTNGGLVRITMGSKSRPTFAAMEIL